MPLRSPALKELPWGKSQTLFAWLGVKLMWSWIFLPQAQGRARARVSKWDPHGAVPQKPRSEQELEDAMQMLNILVFSRCSKSQHSTRQRRTDRLRISGSVGNMAPQHTTA